MFRSILLLLAATVMAANQAADPAAILRLSRSSPGDLEVGGELAGLPAGSTRYIRYDDLLRLPQENYTVSDDSNFHGKTQISGIALTTLAQLFGQSADMLVAICYDQYRANYPSDYLAAHHPVLVLLINGQTREHWPPSENNGPLGPYLISHPFFKPSFKVLSHDDEPQIPFGINRIEFRRQSRVYGVIRPPGNWPDDSPVAQGYVIARQDCFRCHNMSSEGGTLAHHSWLQLASIAAADPSRFGRTIRNPASVTPGAKMPAHSDYDRATLDALTEYFQTFAAAKTGPSASPRREPTP